MFEKHFLDIILVATVVFVFVFANFYFRSKSQKKGCLKGKTKSQKIDFFKTLYAWKETDIIFYNEQLRDLKHDELEQFNCWIFNNKYKNQN